jgi:AraC-like DNA-binding protein
LSRCSEGRVSRSSKSTPDARIGVAAQIAFLELAAAALDDPLLRFKLGRDFDHRQIGLLYYAAASADTLGEALRQAERYSAIVSAGLTLKCSRAGDFTIAVGYTGVARHSDIQQTEFLLTLIVSLCRLLTNRRLTPTAVRLVHRRTAVPPDLERFLGCRIIFGEEADEIAFDSPARQLHVVSADPYLNKMLIRYCEEALTNRRANTGLLRAAVENAIAPLLPHGKAKLKAIAQRLGMSSRTLTRRLAAEGVTFGAVLDDLRSDLAGRYLRDRSLSIAQIAWLVGFSGASAFTNACKRWTGVTPARLRSS